MGISKFEIFSEIILNRRSTKPMQMNGAKIPDERVKALLQLAHWAPTHGRTEPWKFLVYANDAVKDFCGQHAELYKANTTNFIQASYDNFYNMGNNASHLVVVVMERGKLPKIPVMEETAATAAAVENILLGATALGVASFWSTGGMTLQPAMHQFLALKEEDFVMGMVYLGYSEVVNAAIRNSTIDERTVWND